MDHDSGDERERLMRMREQKRVEAQWQRQHAQMARRTRFLRQLIVAAVLLFVVLLAILLVIYALQDVRAIPIPGDTRPH